MNNEKQYTVLSFNLLEYINGGVEANKQNKLMRKDIVFDLINNLKPDSIGFQECNYRWLDILSPMLADEYVWVGERNEDFTKAMNPVFYRRDTWKCIGTRTLWLSDTPEVSYSNYSLKDQSRMVTFAILENKHNGERYAHYNTHLSIERAVMRKQLEVLKQITDKCEYPLVLTGDMNINMEWPDRETLRKFWTDSRDTAPKTTDFPSIDYCLYSGNITPVEFEVMRDPYVTKKEWESGITKGQPYYISDHRPVYIRFYLNS